MRSTNSSMLITLLVLCVGCDAPKESLNHDTSTGSNTPTSPLLKGPVASNADTLQETTTIQASGPVNASPQGSGPAKVPIVGTPPLAKSEIKEDKSEVKSSSNALSKRPAALHPPSIAVLPRVKKRGHVGSHVRLGQSQFMVWGAAPSGVMPKALALSVDGSKLFAGNIGKLHKDNIAVYRTDPLSLEKFISYEGSSIELFPSYDGKWLFSTNMHKSGFLDVLDTEHLELRQHIRVKGFPKVILTTKSGETIYLSLWSGDGIAEVTWPGLMSRVLKFKRRKTTSGQPRAINPRGMALSADEKTLYVANNNDHSLSLVDTESFTERSRMKLGRYPRHIVQSADKKTLYISLTGNNAVAVFDAVQNRVKKWLPTGGRPKGLAMSHDERFLYVANYGASSLHIIELMTERSKELPLNVLKVSGLAVHPNDKFIYITGWCTADVWAIQRIDDGDTPQLPLGYNKPNKPCFECDSPFIGCPSQRTIKDYWRNNSAK